MALELHTQRHDAATFRRRRRIPTEQRAIPVTNTFLALAGGIADTGSNVSGLLVGSLGALLVGLGLLVIGWIRRHRKSAS